MKQQKITLRASTQIARDVLRCRNRSNPFYFEINDEVDRWLIRLGWKLIPGTYIDGLSCQFIKDLSKDIRLNAVKK